MKIIVTKQIGKSRLSFETTDGKMDDVLEGAAFFASTPDKCSICQSEEVELTSNKGDGFTFIKVRCLNSECRATSNLGHYKEGGGGFWKKFEKYVPGEEKSSEKSKTSEKSTDDDLPF